MSVDLDNLRQEGWPDAADEIAQLRHDIEQLTAASADLATENERLRKRGDILHEALVDIISYRCNGWNHACKIARKAIMGNLYHSRAEQIFKEREALGK